MSLLVQLAEDESRITIRRCKNDYGKEFFRGIAQFAYPTALGPLMQWFDVHELHDAKYSWDVVWFWGVYIGWFLWLPLLLRVIEGTAFPLNLTFDKLNRTIHLNTEKWASYTEVESIDLLTCISPQVHRRFRIEITCSRLKYIMVVDTPFVGSWSDPARYMLGIKEDRMKTDQAAFQNYQWHQYKSETSGYDKNDPYVREVFTLYHKLCETLGMPPVPTHGIDARRQS